jgi:hypothetical protein
MRKVFISHAAVDKELAELFENLIESGIGIPHDEVFCTSLEGQGIPEGTQDFKEYIRGELDGCDTAIALISENYYASAFCMCELGAIWMVAKNFFPILVPPVNFNDLRGVISGTQCRELMDPGAASALYDRLMPISPHPVPVLRWDVKKKNFLENLPGMLTKLRKPETVKLSEYQQVQKERDALKELSAQLDREIDQMKKQMAEIAKAKDATAVAAIGKKYSTEGEQFEKLLKACQGAVSSLPRPVKEALYHWARGESFAPSEEWYSEVTRAVEDDQLVEDRRHNYQFRPNPERPNIDRAIKQIEALVKFLGECTGEFLEQAKAEFGDTPDLKRRSFWEKYVA